MYYPFLRARQFELIAIRELALEGAMTGAIFPILEPVRESMSGMNLAVKVLRGVEQVAYLVLNPTVGEAPGDGTLFARYLKETDSKCTFLKPALHCHAGNIRYVNELIKEHDLSSCMLICGTSVDDQVPGFTDLVELAEVKAIGIVKPESNRSLRNYVRDLKKLVIRIDDRFEALPRNQDYLEIAEHPFSDEHAFYTEDGYQGFSDYTTLSSDFIEGGGAPRAVVIHLTYAKTEKKIWIRHFTSETNDSIANVQGKFAEAVEKAVRFCRQAGLSNSAINEMTEYYDEQRYPGLGMVKKISIKNHVLVVADCLRK